MESFGQIPFGPLAPDDPDFQSVAAQDARNVLPLARGYASLSSTQAYSDSLPERCVGAISVRDRNQNAYNYAGTPSALYELTGGTWTQRGSGYTDVDTWDFTQYENLCLAAGFGSNLQYIDIGTATFLEAANFQARTCATIRNFVVTGFTFDTTDDRQPYRVRWSARGDPLDWTPSATTLAGFQQLAASGGPVTRIVGREYGIVFQERAISRMTFTGQVQGTIPVVWQFDEVERGIGTIAPRSVVEFAGFTAFFAEDGFRIFDGNRSRPIDDDTVSRSVLRALDASNVDRIVGAVDVDTQTIFWAYPAAGNSNGSPNNMVMYRYGIGKWAYADEVLDHLYQSASPFVDIDTDVGPEDVSAEAPGSLDDKVWAGGQFQLGVISKDGRLKYFDGPPRDATFETGEWQPQLGRRAFLRMIRPILDGATSTVAIGSRNNQADPVEWTDDVPVLDDGTHRFRVNGRYLRARVKTTGEFKDALGIAAFGRRAGAR